MVDPTCNHTCMTMSNVTHMNGSCTCTYVGKRLQRFLLPTQDCQKPQIDRFRVPMHFGADRFTFDKFPPPTPQ